MLCAMANRARLANVLGMTTGSALYTTDILRWAARIPVESSLVEAHGSAERRSPSCGSVVRAEVALGDGRISDAAFKVHACALGQASAAMLLTRAKGLSPEELIAARAALEYALKQNGEWPSHWEELALLERARDYPGRHAALLIGYDALIAAIENAQQTAPVAADKPM